MLPDNEDTSSFNGSPIAFRGKWDQELELNHHSRSWLKLSWRPRLQSCWRILELSHSIKFCYHLLNVCACQMGSLQWAAGTLESLRGGFLNTRPTWAGFSTSNSPGLHLTLPSV
jgi:hypothetical protein